MNLSRGLLGAFGAIKYDLPFKPSNYDEFVSKVSQPCLILSRSVKHNFFGGGISAVSKSPWGHALVYLGKSLGERARKLYPELMGKRKFYFRNKIINLPPIPEKSCYHEIIESSLNIVFGTLDHYNNNDEQLVAWMVPLTPQQIDDILFRAMLLHGMPYDVQEIAAFVNLLPNPGDGKIVLENGKKYFIGMKVCSSYASYVFNLPLTKPSPGDIDRFCKNTVGYSRLTFQC